MILDFEMVNSGMGKGIKKHSQILEQSEWKKNIPIIREQES